MPGRGGRALFKESVSAGIILLLKILKLFVDSEIKPLIIDLMRHDPLGMRMVIV